MKITNLLLLIYSAVSLAFVARWTYSTWRDDKIKPWEHFLVAIVVIFWPLATSVYAVVVAAQKIDSLRSRRTHARTDNF